MVTFFPYTAQAYLTRDFSTAYSELGLSTSIIIFRNWSYIYIYIPTDQYEETIIQLRLHLLEVS